jgi:hypothetical protein
MDARKRSLLEESHERIINVGFCIVPYEDLSDIIDINPVVFGTTKDENIFSIEEVDALFKSQFEQMGNMKPALDRKRIATRISPDGNSAFIVEEITLTLSSPEETNTIFMRASCVMEYVENRWKLTHWHTSTPVDTENDHWHQEEWKREKEKLQALVDQQTADLHGKNRELEIEASIERVRAVAMGMTKPEDMLKVCRVISDQLQQFGVEHIRNVQTAIINEQKGTYHNYQYFTPYDKESFEITEGHKNPTVQAMIDRMLESPDAFFTTSLTGEELATFRSYRKQENQFPDPLLDDTKSLNGYFFSIGPGGLGITLYRPLNEDGLEIFKRFHSVFSLAYRRFRDIEKAEAQAREAQIQLALERVRARTMAMQNSDELMEVSMELFTQFKSLGELSDQFSIGIFDEDKQAVKIYATLDGEKFDEPLEVNRDYHQVSSELWKSWKSNKKSMTIDLSGESLASYNSMRNSFIYPKGEKTFSGDRWVIHVAFFSHGILSFSSTKHLPQETGDLLERFAKVFEQTYTRFLDLQKAEAQAREAQIELSLERIRAQVTAMQESSDLLDIVVTMRTEFVNLDHEAHYFWHMRWLPERYDKAMTSGDGTRIGMVMTLPRHIHGDIQPVAEWEKSEDPTFVLAMDVDTAVDYVDKMISLGDFEQVDPQAPTLDDIRHIGGLTFIMARTTHGEIGYSLPGVVPNPPKDAIDTLVRFAGVFDLAYKRFEDLKAAERQHREAQIELALERVRARTMAMQSSDEFADVAAVLFDQVRTLGGNLWGTGFGLCEENADNDEFWFANENGVFPAVSIPNTTDPAHKKMYEGWKNEMEFLALEGSGEDLKNHYNYMMTLPEVRPFFQKILDEGLTFPECQQWNAAYFSHGYLLIITLEPYSNQEILKRFARVFDQTYTRFLDLKKAEAQARESEIQLALERVRARSMAMHQSDELADLSLELVKQVHALGIDTWFCAFNIYDDHPEGSIEWGSNGQGTFPRYRTPREGVFLDYYEAGKRGETLLINEIGEDECPTHYDYLCSLPGVGEQLLQMKDAGIPFPAYQIDHAAFFRYGYILFITFEPVPKAHEIFKRFAKVFQQTYTRFLDLQKAEDQAREAKIESALERVRSRSLAMHHSSELSAVVDTLMKEFTNLEFTLTFCIINLINEQDMSNTVWAANPEEGKDPESYYMKFEDYPFHHAMWDAWKAQKKRFVYIIEGKEKKIYDEYLYSETEFRRFPKHVHDANKALERYVAGFTFFKYSGLQTVSVNPISEDELEILERFGRVFEQAYTRFLDLQKAEAQAREAEIQLALERVRAKTMAMKTQSDLLDIIELFGEQLNAVGIRFDNVTFIEGPITKKRDWDLWSYAPEAENTTDKILIPYIETPYFTKTAKAVEAYERTGNPIQVKSFTKKEKNEFLDHYWKHAPAVSDEFVNYVNATPGSIIVDAFLKEVTVSLVRWDLEPCTKEELAIFERFAKEFKQTYIRFLDIKKAEEQAREAEIEAALERVRSRSLAMHKTDELQDVVRVVAEELKNTGVILDTGGAVICTYFQDSKDVIHWTATDDPAHPSVPYLLPYFEDELFDEAWESKSRGDDYFAKVFPDDVKNAFFSHAFEHSDYRQLPDEYKKIILESKNHGIAWAWAENSAIMIPSIQRDLPSEEEKKTLIRFAKVFEQSFIRFLDLQKAEEQAREARIEASLEKVRAQSMGMQGSEDLSKVASVMFDQMKSLGGELFAFGIVLCDRDKDTVEQWHNLGNEGMIKPFTVPVDLDYIHQYRYDQWKAGEELFSIEIPEDYITEHFNLMFELPSVKAAMDEVTNQGVDVEIPDWEIDYGASFRHGYLLISSHKPFDEGHIFPRFAKVFDQAYTRFLDLQKAEAQAREAEIEASLERVRAKAMAMHSSKDIESATAVVFNELSRLGIDMERCGITLMNDTTVAELWSTPLSQDNNEVTDIITGYLDFRMHPILEKTYKDWQDKKDFSTYKLVGDEVKKYYAKLEKQPEYKFPKIANYPHQQVLHSFYFKEGAIFAFTIDELSVEANEIIQKFTKVFSQTYTRFLDIQKAEAQAREAQIENALEKVRSRSLAMQHPDELVEVAQLLREEMGALGVEELETSSIYIHDDTGGLTQCWFTIKNADDPDKSMTDQMTINLQDTRVGRQMNEFYGSGQDSTSILMKGDHRIEWIRYCEEKSDLFGKSEFYGESIPERTYHLYKFSNGFLGAASPGEISDESWDLMRRATGVFSFAYTRFRDLQKAEESARRARQQASLDRVRADISSMRSAEDLDRVTPLIWNELTTLGIPFIRCGIFIIHVDEEQVEVYLSKPDGTSLAVMHLPFGSSELVSQTVDAWQQGSVYTQHWTQEEFLEWGRSMIEQGQVQDLKSYQGAEEAPESLHLQFLPFNQGMLYVGSINPLDDGEISLSESLAKAFSIAYARYEDFVKLEKAKAGIEEALTELKATQSQLVQQEKLASLGQLTAGIAHEIKNPLNFVNNFSEVSVELIEEAREEVRRVTEDRGRGGEKAKVKSEKESLRQPTEGKDPSADGEQGDVADLDKGKDSKTDQNSANTPLNPLSRGDFLLEILDDIEANLRKIHEHGSRADSIVKSMLQHSRGGMARWSRRRSILSSKSM